jgi:hypothetical protein
MTDPEWKAELRRQLETAGEAQVRGLANKPDPVVRVT